MDLKTYLAHRGMSQVRFSKESGISQPQVCRFVNGQVPTLYEALRLFQATRGAVHLGDMVHGLPPGLVEVEEPGVPGVRLVCLEEGAAPTGAVEPTPEMVELT